MQTIGGATALMYACQQCRENEVLEILKKQPFSVKHRDRTLKTPLHYCAENPNTACAEAVLKVAPELVNAQDENGYCTLHLAVIAGNQPLIKLLITKGADVNIHDNEGHSAVHWAIVSSEKEALEMIIRAGANPSTPDIHGGYPLHYAVQMCGSNSDYIKNFEDTVRVVETLLNFGVDVNVKDKDGRQPILWGASAGSADAVIHLVSGGACVEAADKDGLTALHCAASRGHTAALETLISLCGANVDVIDGNGCSALFYSVTLGHADATELLLKLGAEPNRQDRKGRTPAHCGAAKGQLETLRILQKHGGNLWMRNVKGDIPLHEAVASGRKDLVLWLLSQNSDAINVANNDGRSPIHIASMYNNTEMVKVLLDSKSLVNPVMRTSKGVLMTPLNVALYKGHRSCGKYLQLHGGIPFSKVSKVETSSGLPVSVSPPDGMVLIVSETSRDNTMPSRSKISGVQSGSSTDNQRNQETIKTGTTEKRKVYRRRKKKKSPSNKSTDSDSDDGVCDLKSEILDIRKNEKSNEKDGVRGGESDACEEKMSAGQIQDDTKTVLIEKSSKKLHVNHKMTSSKRSEFFEEASVVKKSAKTKTVVQKNKSFNGTKNISDISPEDFPPSMQAINQLDTVIAEPDLEFNKSENDNNESKFFDTATVNLSRDKKAEVKIQEEIIEKVNDDVRSVSDGTFLNKESKIQVRETNDKDDENICSGEKSEKSAEGRKSDTGFQKDKRTARSFLLKTSSDENSRNSAKSPRSLNDGDTVNKESKIKHKSAVADNLEGSDLHEEKTCSGISDEDEADLSEDRSPQAKFYCKNEEVLKPDGADTTSDQMKENEESKTELEIIGDTSDNVKQILQLSVDDLPERVDKFEKVFTSGTDEIKAGEVKNEDVANVLSSPHQKEVFAPVLESFKFSNEKEEIKPLKMQTSVEEVKIVANDQTCSAILSDVIESDLNLFEKDFIEIQTISIKNSHSPRNVEKLVQNFGKPSVLLSEKAEVQNTSESNISNGKGKKISETAEKPRKENLHTVKKPSGETDEKAEESVQLAGELSNRKEDIGRFAFRNEENDQILKTEIAWEEKEIQREGSSKKAQTNFEHRQFKSPKVPRLCRRQRDFKDGTNQISVTQLVQNTIRKYHMERGIFYQLLELKRYQIRSGRANEQVLVKRLADEYERSRVFLGMRPFAGLYKFREFEKFLYDQLKVLNNRRSFIIPEIKSYDDIDTLSGFLKKSRYKIISEIPQPEMVCTCITQRCHHSACAYTSLPCSAYITDLRRRRHNKPRKDCFFPRIEQSSLKSETQKFTERPAALELIQGSEKHVITLPQNSPTKGKRYYVTFTIRGSPAFKENDFEKDSKDHLKHRHAKSV